MTGYISDITFKSFGYLWVKPVADDVNFNREKISEKCNNLTMPLIRSKYQTPVVWLKNVMFYLLDIQ